MGVVAHFSLIELLRALYGIGMGGFWALEPR
jgi:hypothetical protein